LGGLCQEIEHLRLQLQLTREKNGVYVDPNEFANMEARIESQVNCTYFHYQYFLLHSPVDCLIVIQESQLLECETALRSRNEEVKTLRTDFKVLEDKLGTTVYIFNEDFGCFVLVFHVFRRNAKSAAGEGDRARS